MKISQLVLSLLILIGGGVLAMYSADQQKVMDLLVTTHGGGSQITDADATGLRKLNTELDGEVARVSGERAAAVNAAEAARVELRDMRDKCADAKAKYEKDQSELDEWRAKVDDMAKKVEELRSSFASAIEKVKGGDALSVSADSDFATVMESIKSVVGKENARTKELTEKIAEEETVRATATEKLATLKVELNKLNAANEKFFKNYTKNADEFALQGVDLRWKFVSFHAGKDSGLVAGDATPLLLKRGGQVIAPLRIVRITEGLVVAEFSEKDLPAGVVPQVGDSVFRVKPLSR